MKLPSGPRNIYITQELSDLIGDLEVNNGKFVNVNARILELCRLAGIMESRIRNKTDKRTIIVKKETK